MSRFNKVKTNRDVYRVNKEASDAWIKWAQTHPNRFESFTEWLELPYEETEE